MNRDASSNAKPGVEVAFSSNASRESTQPAATDSVLESLTNEDKENSRNAGQELSSSGSGEDET